MHSIPATLYHVWTFYLLLLLGFQRAYSSVANITLYYDTECKKPGELINPLLNNAGNCTSSLSASDFTGIKATYLGTGCTLTFYNDPYCSTGAILAELNNCGSLTSSNDTSSIISSFSIDSCSSTNQSDWNSASGSTTTSMISLQPTSTGTGSDGGGLAVGSEVGSIVGAICGFLAIVVAVLFGVNQWKKHNRDDGSDTGSHASSPLTTTVSHSHTPPAHPSPPIAPQNMQQPSPAMTEAPPGTHAAEAPHPQPSIDRAGLAVP